MKQNIKLLALFNFFTDFKFHSGILIIYFANVTGSFTLAMSLFSVVSISSAVFEIPTGIYSDVIGRKRTIIFGALSAILSMICYAAGQSYWPLFLGALLEGLSRSWYSGNNDAFLHDTLTESGNTKQYAHYLGKTSALFQLALMVGAVLGSILAQWSFSFIMWLSVIPQIISFIIALFFREPKVFTKQQSNIFTHIKLSAFTIWKNKKLQLLNLHDIIGFGLGESSFNFNSAFIHTVWPLWAIGFSRVISYGGAFISFWLSSKIIKKLGEYNILILANIYTRVVNFLAYGFPTILSPVLMASSSVWYGVNEVSKNSLMQREYTQEQRATLSSMGSFFGNIFYGAVAPVIGLIADTYGPAKALLVVQFGMLSVLYISYRLKQLK